MSSSIQIQTCCYVTICGVERGYTLIRLYGCIWVRSEKPLTQTIIVVRRENLYMYVEGLVAFGYCSGRGVNWRNIALVYL